MVNQRMQDGSIRIGAKPDFSNRTCSQEQQARQRRFKQAAAYARPAAQTKPIYAELAGRTMKNAYNIALSDICWVRAATV